MVVPWLNTQLEHVNQQQGLGLIGDIQSNVAAIQEAFRVNEL